MSNKKKAIPLISKPPHSLKSYNTGTYHHSSTVYSAYAIFVDRLAVWPTVDNNNLLYTDEIEKKHVYLYTSSRSNNL